MPGQMTISGHMYARRHGLARNAAIVIIALASCVARAGATPAGNLTTTAPRLDAVVIEGSSVYQAPRLFTGLARKEREFDVSVETLKPTTPVKDN